MSLEIASGTTTIHIAMNVAMIPDVPMVPVSHVIDHSLPPGLEVVPVDLISLHLQPVATNDHLKIAEVATIT